MIGAETTRVAASTGVAAVEEFDHPSSLLHLQSFTSKRDVEGLRGEKSAREGLMAARRSTKTSVRRHFTAQSYLERLQEP